MNWAEAPMADKVIIDTTLEDPTTGARATYALKDVSGGAGTAFALPVVPLDASGNVATASGGGGPATIADGADVAQGAKADAAWDGSAASPTIMAVLKRSVLSGSPVALASPPAATNAGSATHLVFAADINHLYLINQSNVAVGVEWDGRTADAGSYQLGVGLPLTLDVHIPAATGISLYTASAVNINGATGSNLVVKGTT
jgi:hypothetical protein